MSTSNKSLTKSMRLALETIWYAKQHPDIFAKKWPDARFDLDRLQAPQGFVRIGRSFVGGIPQKTADALIQRGLAEGVTHYTMSAAVMHSAVGLVITAAGLAEIMELVPEQAAPEPPLAGLPSGVSGGMDDRISDGTIIEFRNDEIGTTDLVHATFAAIRLENGTALLGWALSDIERIDPAPTTELEPLRAGDAYKHRYAAPLFLSVPLCDRCHRDGLGDVPMRVINVNDNFRTWQCLTCKLYLQEPMTRPTDLLTAIERATVEQFRTVLIEMSETPNNSLTKGCLEIIDRLAPLASK